MFTQCEQNYQNATDYTGENLNTVKTSENSDTSNNTFMHARY